MEDRKHNYFDTRGYNFAEWKAQSKHSVLLTLQNTKTEENPNFDGHSLSAITKYFKNNKSNKN